MSCARPALRLAFGVLWLCAAASARAVEPSLFGRTVRTVRLESEYRIDEEGLRRLIPIQGGMPLTVRALDETHRLLELKQTFARIDIDIEPIDDQVDVVVTLERTKLIGVVRADGYEAFSRQEMSRLVRLEPGTVFEPSQVGAARQRIEDRYRQLGFAAAAVRPSVRARDGEVDVSFAITEGEPTRVAHVELSGDAAVVDADLRAVVAKFEGKNWTRQLRRDAERAVLRQCRKRDYYEARVTTAWDPTGDGGTLRVQLAAGPPFEIEVVGNQHKREKKLLDRKALRDRLLITDGTWRELGRLMLQAYQADGYYRATVRVEIGGDDPKRVRFVISEGRPYRLRGIEFAGNRVLDAARLRREMALQPAGWWPWPRRGVLIDETLDDDLRRLWFFYREKGFDEAQIIDARRDIDEESGDIVLRIVIEEGRRTVIEETRFIAFEGLKQRPVLRLRTGKPFNPKAVDADRSRLLRAFNREGYADAAIEVQVERQRKPEMDGAIVTWTANPGAQRRVGRIIVQQNIDTRDEVILRELPFKPGDPLDTGALLEGQSKVYRVGLFRMVLVRPSETDDEPNDDARDVVVQVNERSPGRLEWGLGFNTRDGVGALAGVQYDNLGGMARRVGVRGQFTIDPTDLDESQYLASVTYRDPRLRGWPWAFQSTLLGERSTKAVDQFSIERVGLVTGVDRELRPKLRGGAELQIERSNVFDVQPDARLTAVDEGSLWTVAPSVFLILDQRDDPFAPTAGRFESIRLRYGLPELSTVHFAKLTLQHSQYLPVTKDVVFVYAARGGYGRALDSDQLPIRERFFLGGRSTVRGFKENDLGPLGEDGDPIGGDVAINLNAEIRFPLVYGFGGAVFVDGGGVYLQDADQKDADGEPVCQEFCAFSFDNFRHTAGIGLRYVTPIGPLSLDYGVKLDRRSGESFGEFHFSIGASF